MKHISFLLLLFVLCASTARAQSPIVQTVGSHQYIFSAGQWKYLDPATNALFPIDSTVDIRFKATAGSTAIAAFIHQFGLAVRVAYPYGYSRYNVVNPVDFFAKCDSMRQSPLVDAFCITTMGRAHLVPNDWVILGPGGATMPGGPSYTMHERLGTYAAWDITTGKLRRPIVAVIDYGMDYTHTDIGVDSNSTDNLYQNMYVNNAEDDWANKNDPTSGNGIDDDNNGFIDDYKGVNFTIGWASNPTPWNDAREPEYIPNLVWTPQSMLDPGYGREWAHGTAMAGLIGAKTNNAASQPQNTQTPAGIKYYMAGVAGGDAAQGARILPLSIWDTGAKSQIDPTATPAITYARKQGAEVTNISLGLFPSTLLGEALDSAYAAGITVVASAGNGGVAVVQNPASRPSVIAVGGVDPQDYRAASAQYGTALDIVAPFYENNTILIPGDSFYVYGGGIGTSGAAAMVSGTVALMKDINPCLSPKQVDEVLKATAFKAHSGVGANQYYYYSDIARPGWNNQMGYGRLRIDSAVWAAQQMYKTSLDLYVKDVPTDFGIEPAITYGASWNSPDIWVRSGPDGIVNQWHQNPVYEVVNSVQVPRYVYVRNKSCADYTGTGMKLVTYWAKAATNQVWPASFNDPNTTLTPTGRPIDSIIIPPLPAGKDTILRFTWYPPNPVSLSGHFCLLARIKGTADPVASELINVSAAHYAAVNNNVAQRNLLVLSPVNAYAASFTVGTMPVVSLNAPPTGGPGASFSIGVPEGYANILADAAVDVTLDSLGWALWTDGGRQGSGVAVRSEDDRRLRVTEPGGATLAGIRFPGTDSQFYMTVSVHFPADSTSLQQQVYALSVTQTNPDEIVEGVEALVGGETFSIYKESRSPFWAYAGPDKTINRGGTATLTALSIGEGATYSWYDASGIIAGTGQSVGVSPEASKQYYLEVTAEADGFHGIDSVVVTVRDGAITSTYPNPVSNSLTVDYTVENAGVAYLLVSAPYSNVSYSYPLNTAAASTSIDMSSYPLGVYNVMLICDGYVMDAESVVKQ